MKNLVFSYNNHNFVRVSKKTAKRFFDKGLTVVFCPCNLRPFGFWGCESFVNPANCDGQAFDTVVNSFEYYNCNLSETGKYTAFYIPAFYADKKTGIKDDNGFLYMHNNSKNNLVYDETFIY